MSKQQYFEDQVFSFNNTSIRQLTIGTYEGCRFEKGNFSGTDLSGCRFIDCSFEHCILDRVQMGDVSFNNVEFLHCKMMGIDFEQANQHLFIITFKQCILNFSSFHQRKLTDFIFTGCELQEVDFSSANLTAAVFDHCDLLRATFSSSILTKADLRTATNYTIDPEDNKIAKARFSLDGVAGLLSKYKIEISH